MIGRVGRTLASGIALCVSFQLASVFFGHQQTEERTPHPTKSPTLARATNSSAPTTLHLQFVHIAKNAGTTIEDVAWKYHGIKWGRRAKYATSSAPLATGNCPSWHLPPRLNPGTYRGKTVFCVVRDPRSRLLSEFLWRQHNSRWSVKVARNNRLALGGSIGDGSSGDGGSSSSDGSSSSGIDSGSDGDNDDDDGSRLGGIRARLPPSLALAAAERQQEQPPPPLPPKNRAFPCSAKGLNAFVQEHLTNFSVDGILERQQCHLLPQTEYVHPSRGGADRLGCTSILRMERLDEDVAALTRSELGFGIALNESSNVVGSRVGRLCSVGVEDLTAASLGLVAAAYTRDFEALGYSVSGPPPPPLRRAAPCVDKCGSHRVDVAQALRHFKAVAKMKASMPDQVMPRARGYVPCVLCGMCVCVCVPCVSCVCVGVRACV